MTVETHVLEVPTQGNCHVVDLTQDLHRALASGSVRDGIVTVFVVGSTGAITTTEYEPGLVNTDLRAAFERYAPEDGRYAHEETWHDDNGHSHVRASTVGPSLTVPLVGGQLTLGTWQQIVLLDLDTRGRQRKIVVQTIGE